MITYRLADSLPQKVLNKLKDLYQENKTDAKQRKYIETMLDAGYGSCILQINEIANIVIENWFYFDSKRYDLIAYVVMPNHVHLLIKTYEKLDLKHIVHSWKSYTANEIKKALAGKLPALPASVWQCDYWDRFIRDENHFNKAIEYIHNNPVKAGLVNSPEKWNWSSSTETI